MTASTKTSITSEHFQQLLQAARAKLAAQNINLDPAYDNLMLDAETSIEVAGTSSQEIAAEIILDTLLGPEYIQPTIDTEADKEAEFERQFLGQITPNTLQQSAIDLIASGADCVIIGAAGTGKTTIQKFSTTQLIKTIARLRSSTKYLHAGKPGVAIVSFTNKAVNNIRHVVHPELKAHTVTAHKLLEFKPNWYEIEDGTGGFKKTVRFEPSRDPTNPLPSDLAVIIYEESSMVGVELYSLLQAAMPHAHQEVFIGDIQQLPPVFGPAILGFKMSTLPVIELTEIYRQSAHSPILDLAWSILDGDQTKFSPITERRENGVNADGSKKYKQVVTSLEQFNKSTTSGQVIIQTWQRSLDPERALITAAKFFNVWSDNGYYLPEDDIILMPYNKAFGTIELNKSISQHLGNRRSAIVYEVIAGFDKHYLAIGDRVLYDKEDAVITDITINGQYAGKTRPMTASVHLNRWGNMQAAASDAEEQLAAEANAQAADISADDFLDQFLDTDSAAITDRVNAASHVVTIQERYSGEFRELSSTSEIKNLLGGYALTVHKFQGSENDRVFLLFHQQHAAMISRELLYTAVTRAKNFLQIICEKNTFFKGVAAPRIKGNTIAEKAEYFKGKIDSKRANSSATTVEMQELLAKTHKCGSPLIATAKPTITTISGRIAIDLREIVPEVMSKLFELKLKAWWKTATQIFSHIGPIGDCPRPIYTTRKNYLGFANFRDNTIALSAIWMCVAHEDTDVEHEMLEETLIHEICHHIAWRLFHARGHQQDWRSCMIAMGKKPLQYYYGGKLPAWTETKNDLLHTIMNNYKLEQLDEQVDTTIEEE